MLRSRSLAELFETQAIRTPDKVALVHGDESLTYGALHDRASRISRQLADLGVREETLVAIAFPRSADAVVCLLAIILAGGAYLPLNPSFPTERLNTILTDARTPLVVCAAHVTDAIAAALPDGVSSYAFEDLPAAETTSDTARSPQDVSGEGLAYVMYTSGSTGRPKGVMVPDRGVVRLVTDTDYFDFSPHERFLLTGALEFDASTFEIWGALLNGATLHIVDHETLVVPARLKQALLEARTTVLWLTAPLFNQLVDEDAALFASLGTLLIGGDTLSCGHVNRVRAACPGLRVLNGYGPTENTTFTTVFPIERPYEASIPIGRPITGTTIRILDADMRPVATGQIGELFTGGLGLARGYLHNAEATTSRFPTLDGERYYRTGDLVSMDTTGVVSFHGRTDDQVKIRGHRVEVKEVTSVLLDIPGVRDAHTLVTDTGTGKRLLGYAVLDEGSDEDSVLGELRRRLPVYMHPERIVGVPRLPLNANGKVDTARLPSPTPRATVPTTPRTPDEEKMARLWAEVLHRDAVSIGPQSDFFELGGTSLTAGALIGRIGRTLGTALGFQDLFTARTLRRMAAAAAAAADAHLEPISAVPTAVPVPLHPQQRGLYALWQTDEASLAYNIPVRLDVSGRLDADRLRTALDLLAERHDALRTRFITLVDEHGIPEVRQIAEARIGIPLDVVSRAQLPTDEAALGVFVRPFDLAVAPLVRAMLVPGEDCDDRLYLDVHHIVFDGVSLAVLVDELLDLYAGVVPAEGATTYGAASQWMAQELDGGRFAEAQRYWSEKFREVPVPLDLLSDYPRPALRSTRGDLVRRQLGGAHRQAIADCAARHAITDFSVLLVAYATVLARLTGQRDLVIGCPMSGRIHPDLDRVVGMFVNTVPLRLRVEDDTTVAALLEQAGHEHRWALAHQAYPFERLSREVVQRRDLSRNALFDAFFALQNIDFHTFRKHGRRITVTLLHAGTSRFDLNLQVYQRPEGPAVELEYAASLFTRQSAEHLLEQVMTVLDEVLHQPGAPVLPSPGASAPAPSSPAADFAF